MYAQFHVPKYHHLDDNQLNFQKCIFIGNWSMVLSLIVVCTCLLITYGFEQDFTIKSQIVGHISTIIFAALLKIGYVIRCIGVHGLGGKVF